MKNYSGNRKQEMRNRKRVDCCGNVDIVFGRLKQNWRFRRFLLKIIEKVSTEWGILSIAHKIAKEVVA